MRSLQNVKYNKYSKYNYMYLIMKLTRKCRSNRTRLSLGSIFVKYYTSPKPFILGCNAIMLFLKLILFLILLQCSWGSETLNNDAKNISILEYQVVSHWQRNDYRFPFWNLGSSDIVYTFQIWNC